VQRDAARGVEGRGQLVGYPIMAVEDVRAYVRTMEGAIVAALAQEGVSARARADEGADYTGVWVDERKIASIGVHVQRGVTTHGFAVNVDNDLEPFTWIVACGLPDVTMTSLAHERVRETSACEPPLPCFRRRVAHSFCTAHERRQRLVTPRALGIATLLAGARSERGREPVPA
jgi:lipoyl(octanoyl) transferase